MDPSHEDAATARTEPLAPPGDAAPTAVRKPYARPTLTPHGRVHWITLAQISPTEDDISPPSDRNLKEAFAPVDPRAVLARVAALPIETWSYKGETARHLGPMAQDFVAAFGLGADDRHIFPLDAGGVALAAIQGLHALVRAQDARLRALEDELAALRAEVAARDAMAVA